MTLKEKFAQFTKQESWEKMNYNAKECELIADDYAIEFADWLLINDTPENAEKFGRELMLFASVSMLPSSPLL